MNNDADYLGLNIKKLGDKELKGFGRGPSFKSNKNALMFTVALFCSLGGGCALGKYANRTSEYDRKMKNIGNLFNNYLKNYEEFMQGIPNDENQRSIQYKMLRDFIYVGGINVMDDEEYNNMCQMLNTTPEDCLTMKS